MRKYQFRDDNSSGFFNQLASMYAKQFQDPSFSSGGEDDDSEYVLPEELNGEPADYNSDGGDYEDLLSKYNDLQDQFNQFSAQSQMPDSTPYQDDSFLNFLFSKDDNNLPIDPEALNQLLSRGASGAASGINPNVLKTQQDVFTEFPGTKSLGIWGDQAHQQRASDHNTGDAEDFAFKSPTDAQSIVSKLQSEADQRKIKYIIYNKKIWNPSISKDWRPYDGPNPHTDHIHVSYKRQYQTGGVAWTAAQQYQGLNDAKYNKLLFPMDGWNTFRGLDNNQPVLIQDQLGKKQILKGKYDTASFYGQVRETRI